MVEAGRAGLHRGQAVDVDANVVVVDVLELAVLPGVELNGKHVIGRVAIVGASEEAQVLYGKRGEILAWCDQEGEAMAAQVIDGDDAEHEGGGERLHRAVGRVAKAQWSRVEGVAHAHGCAIGQLEQPALCGGGCAVEGEASVGEAGVDELVVVVVSSAEGCSGKPKAN